MGTPREVEKIEEDSPEPDEVYGLHGIWFGNDVNPRSECTEIMFKADVDPLGSDEKIKHIKFIVPAELLGDFAAQFLRIKRLWEEYKATHGAT